MIHHFIREHLLCLCSLGASFAAKLAVDKVPESKVTCGRVRSCLCSFKSLASEGKRTQAKEDKEERKLEEGGERAARARTCPYITTPKSCARMLQTACSDI